VAQPQRPYVPHRTPTRAQPAISVADFALAKPFVPGADSRSGAILESGIIDAAPVLPIAEPAMASIETFLVTPRASDAPRSELDDEEDFAEEPEELPPLEHFLDPLPPISHFSSAAVADAADDTVADEFPDEPVDVRSKGSESDWVETDWQRYDWKSAGALGDTERAQAEASDAWAETDWEVPAPRAAERPRAPSDAIAMALDQIARRIRTGDLSLPGDGSVADPATIAATLAALLGVRR
jgi:hypothetical protein